MKLKKKLSILSLCAVICQYTAHADTMTLTLSIEGGSNITVEESSINKDVDYSNLPVYVVKYFNDTEETIYTGPLSGYDNGQWIHTDFGELHMSIIMDYNDMDTLYVIYPDTENAISYASVISDLIITPEILISGVDVGTEGLRVIAGAEFSGTFSAQNTSDISQDVSIVLALYSEDNRLVNVKSSKATVGANSTSDIPLNYTFQDDESYAKLMFWNNFTELTPIEPAISFNNDSGVNIYYYDPNNRLVRIDKNNGKSMIFTYDNNGNLLSKQEVE